MAHDVNMSLEAGGNGGASARELVLERDLVVRALPPFLGLKESRVGDAGIRALSGLFSFKLDKNSLVTMAGITELIRRSPNLRRLNTHRCRQLIGFRDRISDLMDSNRNKRLGQAEVITTIP